MVPNRNHMLVIFSAVMAALLGCLEVFASSSLPRSQFSLHLNDTHARNNKSVVVNVHHAELRLISQNGTATWMKVARGYGELDLLNNNDMTLALSRVALPPGTTITQIRLVLGQGNYVVQGNGRRCELRTPGSEQNGIKLTLQHPISMQPGYNYSVVMDFDAEKSVVNAKGGCVLKPVLRLKAASRVAFRESEPVEDFEFENPENVDVGGIVDNSKDTANGGWDAPLSIAKEGSL